MTEFEYQFYCYRHHVRENNTPNAQIFWCWITGLKETAQIIRERRYIQPK